MSIKEIAEKAGVSPATVSRVLNNPNYHCAVPGLREKIWRIAAQCNYVPNEAARDLKRGIKTKSEKTRYINVLMTRMDDSQTDPFFGELLRVIESEIHDKMCILAKIWYMSLFSNDKKCQRTDLAAIVEQMYEETDTKCDGLIIIGKCNNKALEYLKKRYKNIVSVNRNPTNYVVDEVVCDGRKVAHIAVEHLIGLGHRNLGYVGDCHNEARYKGFVDVLQKHGIDLEPRYIIETRQTETEGFAAMEKIMELEECPSAIYCANDITAIGMIKCLNQYKKRHYTPAIIASDDIEAAQNIKPMLTTIRLPKEEMGKFALYLLLDRIQGGHKGNVRMEVEGKLMVRSSCMPAEESTWS